HKALTFMHTQARVTPMLATWFEELSSYDFEAVHRPGIQNILPDHLSRIHGELMGGDAIPDSPAIHVLATLVDDPAQRQRLIDQEHLQGHF
ncbi:hypothetical protein IW145_006188, partial [Coemansia sp. RSA 521]